MASSRKKATATGAGEPRECASCDAVLASANRGRICSPCERSGRGLGDDQEVLDFALGLYPLRQTLGALGLDYIFFHRFFNQALQDELAQLRRTLYHQLEPPRPLSLRDAATWAARMEMIDTRHKGLSSESPIGQLITETSLEPGTPSLLLRALDEPDWPKSLRQHVVSVSQRLRELEDDLPAAIGTLHLALICGTPPFPPGIRASSELRGIAPLGVAPTFVLNVFSAKERDVRTAYEAILGGRFTYIKRDVVPLTSRWQARGPLPVLEIVCRPSTRGVPTPAAVQRFFKEARTPVARFFDGRIKARDYGYALRSWAMLVLIDKRMMAHREALAFWNDRAPSGLSLRFSETPTGESLLSQQLGNLRRRIARWQSA